MNLPPWLAFLAVVPPLVLGIIYFIRDYKIGRYNAISLFVAFLYGMTIEALSLHTQHQYAYANWILMFGVKPNWVPYAIGVSWASLIYVAMRTSDALKMKWWQRPLFDGAAAMTLDLMLDPSMSATRFVPNLNMPCLDVTTPPFGGLGLWTWCVTPQSHTPMWFTVPVANFLGWSVVIMMFSLVVRLGARYGHGETRGPLAQFIMLLLLAALALGGCFVIGPIEIRLSTGPNWLAYATLAAVTAVPFVLVIAQRKTLDFQNTFPAMRLLWPVYGYGCWGTLFFVEKLDAGAWPRAAWQMVATIIVGVTLFMFPYLDTVKRRSSP
jgi:hypothetical protein